ncbi:MAG: hypothetical protein KDD51_06055 [Bdellovibrionales bacterium]|nr:hypothetical protein [Bdellovibrionales bacterium]
MRRLFLILLQLGLLFPLCRSAHADGFVSPVLRLALVPHESAPEGDEGPLTKVFAQGAYFFFPDATSPRGARLLWAEPEDVEHRSLYGRGDVATLSPRQQARAFELAKQLADKQIQNTEDFPYLVAYPRRPGMVLDPPHQTAATFKQRNGGEVGTSWIGVRVDLDRDGRPAKTSLLFAYRDERLADKQGYLALDFDVERLPVRPFPNINLDDPSECIFGLDLGEGPKAIRVLGHSEDGAFVFAGYEEHLQLAKRRPGLVRIFAIPFSRLRALPEGAGQRQSIVSAWSRGATTENEMATLHEIKSPIVIPVQVSRDIPDKDFHLYLAQAAERNSRTLVAGRYAVIASIASAKRRWDECRAVIARTSAMILRTLLHKLRS